MPINRNPRETCLVLVFVAMLGGCGGDSDPSRSAAQWVLQSGGKVGVHCGGQELMIEDPGQLPDEPFVVHSIAWDIYPGDRNSRVTDADLARLAGLAELRELDLWAAEVTDDGLARLSHLTNLQRLQLSQTRITDTGLEHLWGLKQLQQLGLVDTAVTTNGVRQVRRKLPRCQVMR